MTNNDTVIMVVKDTTATFDSNSLSTLKQEMKRISGEFCNYQCPFCPKKIKAGNEAEFDEHIPHCFESRPFPCSKCTKRFKSSQNLGQHDRIHTQVRPYECELCEKKFIQKSHLQQHARLHTGVHPFLCNYCGESFRQNNTKKIHENKCPTRLYGFVQHNNQNQVEFGTPIKVNSMPKLGPFYQLQLIRDRSPITSRQSNLDQMNGDNNDDDEDGPIQKVVVRPPPGSNLPERYHLIKMAKQTSVSPPLQEICLDHPLLQNRTPTPTASFDHEYFTNSTSFFTQNVYKGED